MRPRFRVCVCCVCVSNVQPVKTVYFLNYSSRKNSMNGVLYLVIPLTISSTRPP